MRVAIGYLFLVAAFSGTGLARADLPQVFGAQERVHRPELSPDGKHVAYIGPGPGTISLLFIVDVATGATKPVAKSEGKPLRLQHCGWAAADRLICSEYGVQRNPGGDPRFVPFSRMFALDMDGGNMVALGRPSNALQLYGTQFDGQIIDWLDGSAGKVLMSRYYVPEQTTGRHTGSDKEGYGVDLIDTRTGRATSVESPKPQTSYWSDGRGAVRLAARQETAGDGLLTAKISYRYRAIEDNQWRALATASDTDLDPVAIDTGTNFLYVLKPLDGRQALYRISLDRAMTTELVFAHPEVDVSGVVTIGRQGRVIGATYATERPHVEYFDPEYRKLAAQLARALPKLPLIGFESADAKERVLLISAGSDEDPGHFYVYEKDTRNLAELLLVRPPLRDVKLAKQSHVQYQAADGTPVPGYLTLPPGIESAKSLPAIVMPHGGPAARDEWGFDWLAQYFAVRGFAVLQPNFRGSAGYGSDWFVRNGFRSWPIAVGDVLDGGRWLVSQGIADPNRLGIVGWSYGGYAALQANVVDPSLFKAVVAVAPVTDLNLLKEEGRGFMNARLIREFIGSGPHIEAGSPARHADRFKAPVLMFHGDLDANVDVMESQVMDRALKGAGKSSELIVYPNLDHQLHDDAVRADVLTRSFEFLNRLAPRKPNE